MCVLRLEVGDLVAVVDDEPVAAGASGKAIEVAVGDQRLVQDVALSSVIGGLAKGPIRKDGSHGGIGKSTCQIAGKEDVVPGCPDDAVAAIADDEEVVSGTAGQAFRRSRRLCSMMFTKSGSGTPERDRHAVHPPAPR